MSAVETVSSLIEPLTTTARIKQELAERQLPVADGTLELLVRTSSNTQGSLSALVINLTEGMVSGAELTSILHAAFPASKISDRHGAYYLSLARTGKLKGANYSPVKRAKAVKAASPAEEAYLEEVKALREQIRQLQATIIELGGCVDDTEESTEDDTAEDDTAEEATEE